MENMSKSKRSMLAMIRKLLTDPRIIEALAFGSMSKAEVKTRKMMKATKKS